MNYSEADQYWIWLTSVSGIGVKHFYQILTIFEDPREVWDNIDAKELRFLGPKIVENLKSARSEEYFFKLFAKLESSDVKAVTRLSDDYPRLLSEIYDPPPTFFMRGDCPLDDEKMFSIVGSRSCTREGLRAATEMARGLAREGVTVVSGMARGADTAAHKGALEGGGRTVAVLGCGADVVYPPENADLMNEILDKGGAIVSEYLPGTPPAQGHFPARNRIISGLTQGTLLVEGRKGSGAMITINHATEQNREVFAIPGSIYSPLSEMPNKLISDGAHITLSPYDILEAFRWASRPDAPNAKKTEVKLDETEAKIVMPLRLQSLTFEELLQNTELSPQKLNSYLTMLELRGIIVKVPGGMYRSYE